MTIGTFGSSIQDVNLLLVEDRLDMVVLKTRNEMLAGSNIPARSYYLS